MEEVWKDCVGFEGLYQVSDLGRVRRGAVGGRGAVPFKVLRPGRQANGYLFVTLRKGGRSHHKMIHRLVLESFKGQPPFPGAECAHYDGDIDNNRPENLRWTDRKGNMADMRRHGRISAGSHRPLAKLTEHQINRIRDDHRLHREIAEDYGVCRQLIDQIKLGQRWCHVPEREAA